MLINNTYILIQFILILIVNESKVNCANNKLDDIFKDAQNVSCNSRTERKAEDLIQILVPAGTDQHIPENAAELRKHCNLFQKNIPFILGVFKHCTSPFARTLAKFMFFPVRKQMDSACKKGKLSRAAKEMLKAGKCGNLAREPLKNCNKQFIDALSGISLAPIKSRIYMTCCHSNAYRYCLRDATEDTVGCTRHTVDWAERFILKMVGGSVSIICGEYFEESDKCSKLISETPKPNYSESHKRPKSFIKPMIELMESFPDLDQQ